MEDEEGLGCEPLLSPIVSPIKPGKRPTSKALPATPSREPPTKRTDTKATPVKEALKDDEAIRGPDQSFGTRPRPKPMVIDTSPSVLVQQSYYGGTSVSSGKFMSEIPSPKVLGLKLSLQC